jgi:hypothetical protein
MEEALREELTGYFAEHDARLGQMLGRQPIWRS